MPNQNKCDHVTEVGIRSHNNKLFGVKRRIGKYDPIKSWSRYYSSQLSRLYESFVPFDFCPECGANLASYWDRVNECDHDDTAKDWSFTEGKDA